MPTVTPATGDRPVDLPSSGWWPKKKRSMKGMNKKVYIRKGKMMGNDHVEKKMDKISNLPMEVIDAILIRLPLKDAVRTSILSRQWRQSWLTISQLIFDNHFIQSFAYTLDERLLSKLMLVNTVDQILYRHQGLLHKFELHKLDFKFAEWHFLIDKWVLYLSTIKGIKEIILWMGDHTKVLNGIFSFKELNHLELHDCTLDQLPSTFEGFPNLKCIVFYSVNFHKDDFSILLDKCPLLERLKFKHWFGTECVAIDAPMLQFLSISGIISVFSWQNTPLVHTASISLLNMAGEPLHNCNFFESLCRLPNLRTLKLKVDSLMLGALKLKSIPKRFTTTLYSLKSLEIQMNFENAIEIFAALCLLRSSPNLCKLKIGICDYDAYDRVPVSPSKHWNADEDHMDCLFHNLVEVHVTLIGFGPELEFIKVVLANSPKLQKMTLNKDFHRGKKDLFAFENAKILKELIQFKRASPDARFYVFDIESSAFPLELVKGRLFHVMGGGRRKLYYDSWFV